MNRRLRIIMDHEHKIRADAKTNWVTCNFIDDDDDDSQWITWNVSEAMKYGRDTLVIQP